MSKANHSFHCRHVALVATEASGERGRLIEADHRLSWKVGKRPRRPPTLAKYIKRHLPAAVAELESDASQDLSQIVEILTKRHEALVADYKEAKQQRKTRKARGFGKRDGQEDAKKTWDRRHYIRGTGPYAEKGGLVAEVSSGIIGQDHIWPHVATAVEAYELDAKRKRPHVLIFIGPSGYGKGDTAKRIGKAMGWAKTVEVNLEGKKTTKALTKIEQVISGRMGFGDRRRILLVNEVDKAATIDPDTDQPKERYSPIIGSINALLDSEGTFSAEHDLDDEMIRPLIILTLNPPRGTYGELDPHPHRTTNRDLMEAHRELFPNPESVAAYLRTLFHENMVNRLMAHHPQVFRPLTDQGVRELTVQRAIPEGVHSQLPKKARVRPMADDSLIAHLAGAAYSPSLGPRGYLNAVKTILDPVAADAMSRVPEQLDGLPLDLNLSYKPKSGDIRWTGLPKRKKDRTRLQDTITGYTGKVPSTAPYRVVPFPKGYQPDPEAFDDALHEFGHALADVHLGMTFQHVRADKEIKLVARTRRLASASARDLMADVLGLVAPRALQRVVYSANAGDRAQSYQALRVGGLSDNPKLRALLEEMLFKQAFNPTIGALSLTSKAVDEDVRVANGNANSPMRYQDMISHVLVAAEDFLQGHFEKAHTVQWYREKATELGRVRFASQADFYGVDRLPLPWT